MQVDKAKTNQTIAISVITGFLGSGKTTLLNYLLQHPEIDETAVLINEFGEIGLDHLLVAELDDEVVLLSSGCICCTVQGELVDSLKGLYMKRLAGQLPLFTRVIIETTGLADPIPIINCLMKDPLFKHTYSLDSLVTTVDGLYGEDQLDSHPEAVKQAAVADRIIITKTDLAEQTVLESLKQRLTVLNPGARVFQTVQGQVSPNQLFDVALYDPRTKTLDVQRWLNEDAYVPPGEQAHEHDHTVDLNRHDDHIRSFCLYVDLPLPWYAFLNWFDDLANKKGDHLLRVKGLVNIENENAPYAVHCVQATRHTPVKLTAWPDGDRRSKMVFITLDLPEADIQADLDAWLDGLDGASGAGPKKSELGQSTEIWLNEGEITRLFGALVEHRDEPAADAIRLMLLTGTRWHEARDARWADIDMERRLWLQPSPAKPHKQPRRIRLSEPAMMLLRRLAGNGGEWLFPGPGGDRPTETIESLWDDLTTAALIEDAELERLRPTIASHLFADQDPAVLNSLLGDSE